MVGQGDRIRVVAMDDPYALPVGSEGTVTRVNHINFDGGFTQISVEWDNGSGLMLCVPPDRYEILPREG